MLDDQTNTGEDGLFLLSDILLDASEGTYFDNTSPISNAWQGSDAQQWCEDFYADVFTQQEQSAIMQAVKSDEEFTAGSDFTSAMGGSITFSQSDGILNGDRVFFLSAKELSQAEYGFATRSDRIASDVEGNTGMWWLRSPDATVSSGVGVVYTAGWVNSNLAYFSKLAARPAFNADADDILFTSAAENGKISADDGTLSAVTDYSGHEWKATVRDDERNFDAATLEYDAANSRLDIAYSGAAVGENEWISVIVTDADDAVTYYGRIMQPDSTDGTASIDLSNVTMQDGGKIYVFSEQYNGDGQTDYASDLQEVPLRKNVVTVSSSMQNLSFTGAPYAVTDTDYYCKLAVTDDDYMLPTTIEVTAGGRLLNEGTDYEYDAVTGELRISRSCLTGDFVITAEGVAKSYGLAVDMEALDFGDAVEGYVAPEAKKLTISNTGNQPVTVALSSAASYDIVMDPDSAGDASMSSSGELSINAGAQAELSIRPKTGLTPGTYDEQLVISGATVGNKTVNLSFTVTQATYTLTVQLNGGDGKTVSADYHEGETVNIDAGVRDGYRFDGWTSSDGGEFADASDAVTVFTMPGASTTITAHWQRIDNLAVGDAGTTANDAQMSVIASTGAGVTPVMLTAVVCLAGFAVAVIARIRKARKA